MRYLCIIHSGIARPELVLKVGSGAAGAARCVVASGRELSLVCAGAAAMEDEAAAADGAADGATEGGALACSAEGFVL